MIEISNIKKTYIMGDTEVNALNGVSLTIHDGEFVAIMGPSGSGKSTLMHVLGLLDVPTSGSYKLNGNEISKLSEDELAVIRRDEIGFIFQQFNLLPRMSAKENVAMPLLYSEHNIDLERSMALLKNVNLDSRSSHNPNELSGGQQQRVAIARSLINNPNIIFADEPTGNLDSQSEKDIMSLLKKLNEEGKTVIVVTHEDEIAQYTNRIIRIRDGIIQSDISKRDNITGNINPLKRELNSKSKINIFELFEFFKEGFKTLAANKVRTFLSMLGILIGVAAVVAVLALGKGAQDSIEKQFSSLGSNMLNLRAGSIRIGGIMQDTGTAVRLVDDDALAIKNKISNIKSVSPAVNGRGQTTFQNRNWTTQILGANSDYAKMKSLEPEIGRFFTEEENTKKALVAVLGATVVKELFEDKNPIGAMIKINKINFLVIGVLPEKGATGWRDQDDVIVMPLNTAMYRVVGKNYIDYIDIEVETQPAMEKAQEDILKLINSRHKVPPSQEENAFTIRNMADIQNAVTQTSQTIALFLASIAAISLLVGGIGIMNIMLVSVTERTREIGLRKAVGAKRFDILIQFLAESLVISTFGGVIGILLGSFISYMVSKLAGWNTTVTVASVILAFGFSAGIGIIFGIYPARKASLLNPIDALRYE